MHPSQRRGTNCVAQCDHCEVSVTKGFDFVIVGAGTAGCILASRLTEDHTCTVCLIEAGSTLIPGDVRNPAMWPQLQGSAVDWGMKTVEQKHCATRVHDWPRGKILGGSTAINAMAHMRGHPGDFDAWRDSGLEGWGYADLLPYFIRSETSPFVDPDLHGNNGPVNLIYPTDTHPVAKAYQRACLEQGLQRIEEHNGREMSGVTFNTLTIKDGQRQTIADAYLPETVLSRPNLTLMPETMAVRTLLQDSVCEGVEVLVSGEPMPFYADKVIMSAGSIATPCLLQRSGIGNPEDLSNANVKVMVDSPLMGRNLHDHLLAAGNVYLARNPVPLSNYQHSESATYIRSENVSAGEPPDMVVLCVAAPVVTEMYTAPEFGTAYTLMFGATHPKSRGKLAITSNNPFDPPFIDPNYLADPYDRKTALSALDWARRIGNSPAMDMWRREELMPTADDLKDQASRERFLENVAYTHHHPVGTCSMGANEDSVVDGSLKLRGIDNLYVVDASVIPSIPTGPMNAALIAIAEKASDMIQGKPMLPPKDWRTAQ